MPHIRRCPPSQIRHVPPNPEYITLTTIREGNIVVHAPSEVAYLEGAKDYTKIILISGAQHLAAGSIGQWTKRLLRCGFLRVHRSYCVNLVMVQGWQRVRDYLLVRVEGGHEIVVAESYKSEFLRHIT